MTVTSAMLKLGAASSFVIVPVPCALPIVALTGMLRFTTNVSSASLTVSPFTSTVMLLVVSPEAKVTVPLAAT